MPAALAAEAAVPVSISKLVLCLLLLLGWGKWAVLVDKDAAYYYLRNWMWNLVQVAAGVIGFAAILLIPLFPVGLVLGLLLMGGAAAGYIVFRNRQVPASVRWHFDADSLRAMLTQRRDQAAARRAALRFRKPPEGMKAAPASDDEHYAGHALAEQILETALEQHAQWVELKGADGAYSTRIGIDGIDHEQGELDPEEAVATIDYLKAQAGLDPADRRRKQSGTCPIEVEGYGEHMLRVDSAGSTRELRCTLTLDPVQQVTIPFEQLGLHPSQQEALQPLLRNGEAGVVLVACPTGQGRTTTLYALLNQLDPYTGDLHTFEPSVERDLEGVTQNEIDREKMARQLESLLLREPDAIMLASLADGETAKAAARGAQEGRRIFAGLSAEDGMTALSKWAQSVGDLDAAADGVSAVLSQRLLRRLCPDCRQPYQPDPKMLKKLNLPAEKIGQLYKTGGQVMIKNKPEPCPTCAGSGYRGRIGAFEVLVFDDEARQMIRQNQLKELRTHLRRRKTMWLQEAALSHVVAGTTSIKEFTRVFGQNQQRARSSSTEQPPSGS